MNLKGLGAQASRGVRLGLTAIAFFQFTIGANLVGAAPQQAAAPLATAARDNKTVTPIKHVIVIIGENRSFDHVFATYVPKNGQTVNNLLSEKIIKLDTKKNAIPGQNFGKAQQLFGEDYSTFLLNPPSQPFANNIMPPPLVGGPTGANGYFSGSAPCPSQPALTPLQCAQESESGLPTNSAYYVDLSSGGTIIPKYVADTRVTEPGGVTVYQLPAGPFQLTNGSTLVYNDYAASPVHRFYQMWQQEGCTARNATHENPSGCNAQFFSYVENTVGAGADGVNQPPLCSSDGTRIPLLVVSKYTTGGHISHEYTDHVSIDKFIERNWNIGTISKRSRDNFPNPVAEKSNPYVPTNSPAIGDLFDFFIF